MIYAYYGKCEAKYFGLFVADNDSSAIRVVEEELRRNQKLANYSSEYSLYSLCNFNDDTGFLDNCELHFISDLNDILVNFLVKQQRQKAMLERYTGVSLDVGAADAINDSPVDFCDPGADEVSSLHP